MGLGFLKNLIGPALGAAGSMTGIPGLGQLGSALGGAIGGGLGQKGAIKSQKDYNAALYAQALRDSRVNQSNPYGTKTWVQDGKGNWSQEVKFSPELQKRFDMFNDIAANRMGAAGKINLPTANIDYDKMGLGSLAAAFGIGQGTTGKRPWASSPTSSMGGDMLRNLTYAGPSANNPIMGYMQQQWASAPPQPTMQPGGGRVTPMMGG